MAIDVNTKLLLHMDGAFDGTTFTDDVGNIPSVYGNVCTKPLIKKFGTASAYFDGRDDYITFSGISIGTGSFTVDFWFYRTTGDSVAFSYGGSNDGFIISFTDSDTVLFAGEAKITGSSTSINSWHHCAIVGNGESSGSRNIKLYIDGALIGTWTVDYNYTKTVMIGANEAYTPQGMIGYIDEFRFSSIARWTSNFTVPTTEYTIKSNSTLAYEELVAKLPESNDGSYTDNSYSAYEDAIALCDLTLTAEDTDEDLEVETIKIQDAYDLLVLNPTIEVLMVAGGGGGGGASGDQVAGGGGAGAGGVIHETIYPIIAGEYPIVIGAGGTGGTIGTNGTKGGNSTFDDNTAYGGGAGRTADDNNNTLSNGGSGGGASGSAGGIAGTGVSGQGYDGGTKNDPDAGSFAGGGGGSAGGAASGRTPGGGYTCDITGSSPTYSIGGYGQGTSNFIHAGEDATANTGNGGNGAKNGTGADNQGGDGGSGIVIIRYLTSDFGECTGGDITTDDDYTIHTFTENGTFTVVDAPKHTITAYLGSIAISKMYIGATEISTISLG